MDYKPFTLPVASNNYKHNYESLFKNSIEIGQDYEVFTSKTLSSIDL